MLETLTSDESLSGLIPFTPEPGVVAGTGPAPKDGGSSGRGAIQKSETESTAGENARDLDLRQAYSLSIGVFSHRQMPPISSLSVGDTGSRKKRDLCHFRADF